MDSNPICHPSPAKKMVFWLCSTSDDWLGWSMDSNPICHPSPAKKIKSSFLDYVQLLIGQAGSDDQWTLIPSDRTTGLVDGLEPHLPPISSQKNEMLIFGLRSTSDDWLGWSMDSKHDPICHPSGQKIKISMDSNPVCHPSPAKKIKCSFLDYIQLLMIGWDGLGTQTLSATPLQKQNKMLIFGLPCLPPLSSQTNKMLHFWITFNFWWSTGLVDGLEPHLPPISSQKNEMLIFGLRSTSHDRLGLSMDSNPVCHPSPAKKIKCSFLDYIQLLMIGWAGQWTQTLSATPLQANK